MNILNSFSQEIPIFGYRLNVGQTLATATALAAVTALALKKICKTYFKPSDENFWQQVKATPTIAKEGAPITINGKEVFPDLATGKLQMSLSCGKPSDYLIYLTVKGTVLDLGCGIGANSIPLYKRGWRVVAIDNQPEAIEAYCNTVRLEGSFFGFPKPTSEPSSVTQEDIITCEYPKDVDAVMAIDVLPYIPPADLKKTLDKIFQALRPGGQFIGTLFFRRTSQKDPTTELMGKLGAHFYAGEEFATEIITRSGFQIKKASRRKDTNSSMGCLEFLAEKPVAPQKNGCR